MAETLAVASAVMEGAGVAMEAGSIISGATQRQCGIEIENECATYTFVNPRIYTKSGYCAAPLPPTVAAGAGGIAMFSKKPIQAKGSIGVVTYDLLKKDKKQAAGKIAVMFHVPYDFIIYKNWYAVGVFEESTQCDEALFNLMYKEKETTFRRQKPDGSCLTYEGGHITIKATMSDAYGPIIKVQVSQNKK